MQLQELQEYISAPDPLAEPGFVSFGEALHREGQEKGLQKGRQEERQAVAKRLLSEGFSPEKVSELAEVSLADVRKLQHGDNANISPTEERSAHQAHTATED